MKLGTQAWGLITVVVVLGVVAAGWFLGVSPQLAEQAQADSQRKAAQSQNDDIRATIADLAKEEANLPTYKQRDEELHTAIPDQVESAAFITSVNNLAAASNVVVEQISIEDVIPYSAPTAAEPAADGSVAPAPVTDSRVNNTNFLLVPVTLTVSGAWPDVLSFTHGVQTSGRLMLVTKVNTSGDGATFSTTLNGAMYVLIRPSAPGAASTDGETSVATAG